MILKTNLPRKHFCVEKEKEGERGKKVRMPPFIFKKF
jgi:hypothetical protein